MQKLATSGLGDCLHLRVKSRSRTRSTIATLIDYRNLDSVFRLYLSGRGFRHHSTTIAPVEPPKRHSTRWLRTLILGNGRGTVGKCTGPKWSKRPVWSKWPYSELDFSIREPKCTKMVHFGPFWPEEVHFGPFRSANHTLAIPDICQRIQARARQALTNVLLIAEGAVVQPRGVSQR